jgi:hypothetical protein
MLIIVSAHLLQRGRTVFKSDRTPGYLGIAPDSKVVTDQGPAGIASDRK